MKKITYQISHLLFIIALVVNGLNSTRSFAEEAQKETSPYLTENLVETWLNAVKKENKGVDAEEEVMEAATDVSKFAISMSRMALQLLLTNKKEEYLKLLGPELAEKSADDAVLEATKESVKKDMGDQDKGAVAVIKVLKANEETLEAAALEIVYSHLMLKQGEDNKASIYTYVTTLRIPLKAVPSIENSKEISKILELDSIAPQDTKIISWKKVNGIPKELIKPTQEKKNDNEKKPAEGKTRKTKPELTA
ncbi:MAG: hypothetical protein KA116_05670 [Proteobacteria bacterium]|nr:hypothetical protein [Pseudomonadota bacterium]